MSAYIQISDFLSQTTAKCKSCSVPYLRNSNTRESLILRGFKKSRRRKSVLILPLLILPFCCFKKAELTWICPALLPLQLNYMMKEMIFSLHVYAAHIFV
jgi:hypothetical protein